jgi:hypothetical protein
MQGEGGSISNKFSTLENVFTEVDISARETIRDKRKQFSHRESRLLRTEEE